MGDQNVRTMVKTLTISKYFVGSGANPVHTHVVVKSLVVAQMTISAIMAVLAIRALRAIMALLAFLTTWTCLKGLES